MPPEADFELDLSSGSVAGLPPKLVQAAQNTGLRIGADGQLVLPAASGPKPSAGKSAVGLDEEGFDPYEIRAYADYGDPPTAVHLTPFYALRVLRRRKELEAELAQRQGHVRLAAERIDDAVVAFGERVQPIAGQHPLYARSLAPIEEAERLLRSRDTGLAGEIDTYKKATGTLDARLRELEKKHHESNQQTLALETELAKLETARSRAEAKQRRAEIELRNLEQSAGGVPTAGPTKVQWMEKTQERDAGANELARVVPLIQAHTAKLEAPRAERAELEREMLGIRRERGEAEQRLKRQSGNRTAGVEDARKRVREATLEFGRVALADASAFGGEFNESRRTIELLFRERAEKERAARMTEKAIASADDAVVKRGLIAAAVGVALLLLLVVGLPLYRVMSPQKPPPLYPTDE
jgi:hypothetical protein